MNRSYSLTNDRRSRLFDIAYRWIAAGLLCFGMASQANGSQQLITKETVEPTLRRYAVRYGPWNAENIELRVLPFQPVTLPPGQVSFRVLQPARIATPGPQSFLVSAEIAGKEEARLWVKTEIRAFDQVVVASAALARQELISAKDVRLERREVVPRGGRPFTRVDDVIGKQSTRAIEINEILTQNSIDKPVLMKRGSAITLVFETGSLRVETLGVAEEGGKIGEIIQVKNPTSGKMLRGVVLDGRNVRVN
jgi:flagella basal body P-ring formation protein FlgA